MDISMDIHGKSGCEWEISYPRQACCFRLCFKLAVSLQAPTLHSTRGSPLGLYSANF